MVSIFSLPVSVATGVALAQTCVVSVTGMEVTVLKRHHLTGMLICIFRIPMSLSDAESYVTRLLQVLNGKKEVCEASDTSIFISMMDVPGAAWV